MNKLILLSVVLFAGIPGVQAQKMDFSSEEYEPLKTAPSFTPDSAEAREPLVYVFDRNYTEYVIDAVRERFCRYHISHTLKYLNDDKAVDDENKLYLPLHTARSLEKLVVRVYKDGKLVSESDTGDLKTVELEHTAVKQLALKGVSKGCLIEIFVLKWMPIETYDFEYFQDEAPRRRTEFRLYAPRNLVFGVKSYNGLNNCKVELNDERRLYYIEQENIPGLKDEKYCYPNANRMRVEYTLTENKSSGGKFPLYPEMGRDFFEGLMKTYKASGKVVKTLLKEAKVPLEEDKMLQVFRIEQYLKTSIKLEAVASYENLKDIFKNKYGSTQDVLRLYVYAFRKLEIDYEVVITTDKSQRRFDREFDSWSYLTDVLFYFPETQQYLDPYAAHLRLGRISETYLGQAALFIQPVDLGDKQSGAAKVRTIPKNKVDQNEDVHSVTLRIMPDMLHCGIDYTRKMSNYADMNLRFAYYNQDDAGSKQLIEAFVKGEAEESELKIVSVTNSNLSDPQEWANPWEVKAYVLTSYYLENAGENKLIKVGELIGAQTEMYSEGKRGQPIEIGYAHRYVRNIVIEIPEGYTAKGLERLNIDLRYKNAAGEYSMGFTSKYSVETNRVIIECVEYYADLSYPVEQYDDFARVINAAADFNKISILIEKRQ